MVSVVANSGYGVVSKVFHRHHTERVKSLRDDGAGWVKDWTTGGTGATPSPDPVPDPDPDPEPVPEPKPEPAVAGGPGAKDVADGKGKSNPGALC